MGKSERSEKFSTHLIEYPYQGSTWTIELKATSEADARARVEALQKGNYLGVLQFKVPVELGVFGKLACLVRNFLKEEGL